MLHVLRAGCPWRDMHERYGKWNSVYVRFRRWAEQGVWDALLQTLVDLGLGSDPAGKLGGQVTYQSSQPQIELAVNYVPVRQPRMNRATDLNKGSLGAVLKTALDAVVVMRFDGTIAGWNDVAQRTFGWTYDDASGRRMSDLIIPEQYRLAHENGLARYLKTGEGPVLDKHIEIEALHRDGHTIPIELSITRTDQFGEPVFLGFLRDITERREAARRQQLMIGELNHRVKNLLGVVTAIAHQTARASDNMDDFSGAFLGRLTALGRAHEILTEATWERASLRKLTEEVLAPYLAGDPPQATIAGSDVLLEPQQLLSLNMVLHELATNAVKYGALSEPEGRLAVIWAVGDHEVSLEWIEQVSSMIEAPQRKGFGSKMIALSVSHELRGVMKHDWRKDGLTFSLTFNIAARGSL